MASFNYALSSMSPLFHYSPFIDGSSADNGWEPFITPNSSVGLGDSVLNNSYLMTSLPGASVFLSFPGSGISLQTAGNSSFVLNLDGVDRPQSSDDPSQFILGLDNTTIHNVTLTVGLTSSGVPGFLFFAGALIVPTEASTGILPTPLPIDNRNTSIISYFGNWSMESDPEVPSLSSPEPFHFTSAADASASLQFRSKALEVRGMIDAGWGIYSVEVDGVSYSYNASTTVKVSDTTLVYLDGMDDTRTHEVTITNVNVGSSLAVSTITVFDHGKDPIVYNNSLTSLNTQASPKTGSSSHVSKGAIIGIVIGVFALVVLNLGVWFLFYRLRLVGKRKTINSIGNKESFEPEQQQGLGTLSPFLLPEESQSRRQPLFLSIPAMRKSSLPDTSNNELQDSSEPQLEAAAASEVRELVPAQGDGNTPAVARQQGHIPDNPEIETGPDAQDDIQSDRRIRAFSERIVDVVVERIRHITHFHERSDIDSPSHTTAPPQYEL